MPTKATKKDARRLSIRLPVGYWAGILEQIERDSDYPGQAWLIKRGEDYSCTTDGARQSLYRTATRLGIAVTVSKPDEQTLAVRLR